MAILGENRVGPNQDINDRDTLSEVSLAFNTISQNIGNFVDGEKIVDIIIPLKLTTGETYLLDTSQSDAFTSEVWSNTLIHTYIGLAEIFRDYWNILNDALGTIDDEFDNFIYSSSVESGELLHDLSSHLGGMRYLFYHFILDSLPGPEPEWTGFGPTNYNYNTYPQLLEAVNGLDPSYTISPLGWLEEIYWYDTSTDDFGELVGAEAKFGIGHYPISESDLFGAWVQLYNHTDSDIEKTLSASISMSSTSISGSAASLNGTVRSDVIIDDIAFFGSSGDFPVIPPSEIYPSGVTQFDSIFLGVGGGSISTTHNRIVTIPPQKSAFIRVLSAGNTSFFTNPLTQHLEFFTSVTIEDKTVNNLLVLGV